MIFIFLYVDDLIANGIIINNYTPGLLRMNNDVYGTLAICISLIEPLITDFNWLYNTLNMPHCSSCILNSPGVTFLKDPLSLRCQIKLWTWDEYSFFFLPPLTFSLFMCCKRNGLNSNYVSHPGWGEGRGEHAFLGKGLSVDILQGKAQRRMISPSTGAFCSPAFCSSLKGFQGFFPIYTMAVVVLVSKGSSWCCRIRCLFYSCTF